MTVVELEGTGVEFVDLPFHLFQCACHTRIERIDPAAEKRLVRIGLSELILRLDGCKSRLVDVVENHGMRHDEISGGLLIHQPSEVLYGPLPGEAGESVPKGRRVKEPAPAIQLFLSWRTAACIPEIQ